MADREKVIDILGACGTDDCDNCPLNGDERCSGFVDVPVKVLMDALALLREQEPRVLEFLEISETTTYWMEDNREANQKTTCIPETIMDIMGDRIFTIPVVKLLNGYAPVISKNREGYGKTWRAWTSRPTEQQMRDTPWEG